ncbi:MAG: DUF1415 domain-containing protein [Lysobacteraceae bacterium]
MALPPARTRDMSDSDPIQRTRQWVERIVIGLNLCPFAKAVAARGRIRYVLSAARSEDELLHDLVAELRHLATTPADRDETTLLVHPGVLTDFLDYNDFLDIADAAIQTEDLEGEIQVASFHPDYRFADAEPEAIENHSNRSPYPMLHLLRESSIDQAVAAYPDPDAIIDRNKATLRTLGHAALRTLLNTP